MLAEAWDMKHWIIFLAPFALLLVGLGVVLLMRKTFCTRFRMARQFRADPDIKEWLIVYNWSRKIFYVPTILASIVAFLVMLFIWDPAAANSIKVQNEAKLVGGIWLAIFFLNYLVDEYEVNLKIILIAVLFLGALAAWLTLLDWLGDFLRFFGRLDIVLNWQAYLLLALIFGLGIVTSWLHGLFYYAAITPNFMNIQTGPTETAEQVMRDNFSTRIDTGDFLERMLGFGRIIITFADSRRSPMVFLVSRVGRKAAVLESLRGVMAVDLAPGKKENGEAGSA